MEQIAENSLLILAKTVQGVAWVFAKIWFVIIWILALPLRILAFLISWLRRRRYNPERAMCPACGFKGDKGTGNNSCRINFIRTNGPEKAALQHICFRCGCDFYTAKMYQPVDKWLPKESISPVERIKEAAKKAVL